MPVWITGLGIKALGFLKGQLKSPTAWVIVALLGIVGAQKIVIKTQSHEIDKASSTLKLVGLSEDSIQAVLDSTRKIIIPGLQDMYEKRILQLSIKQDSLDKALKSTTQSLAEFTIGAHTLSVVANSDQTVKTDSNDVRTAHFTVDKPTATIAADVSLPKFGLGNLALQLTQKPFFVRTRIRCGTADPRTGVRPAFFDVTPDSGWTVSTITTQQAPTVCESAEQPITTVSFLDHIENHVNWGAALGAGPTWIPGRGFYPFAVSATFGVAIHR